MALDIRLVRMIQQARGKYASQDAELVDEGGEDSEAFSELLDSALAERHSEDAGWQEIALIEEMFSASSGTGRSAREQILDELVERGIDDLSELGVDLSMDTVLGRPTEIASKLRQIAWALEVLRDTAIAASLTEKPRIRVPARTSRGNVIPFPSR